VTEPPTLVDLARDPSRGREVPPDAIPDLLAEIVRVAAHLVPRLLEDTHRAAPSAQQLLSVDEVARRSGLSRSWWYKHAKELPFVRRLGRSLRFDEAGFVRWLPSRRG